MSLLGANCWTVFVRVEVSQVDLRSRRWVVAVCRSCNYRLNERLDGFLKREDCPRCKGGHWVKESLPDMSSCEEGTKHG